MNETNNKEKQKTKKKELHHQHVETHLPNCGENIFFSNSTEEKRKMKKCQNERPDEIRQGCCVKRMQTKNKNGKKNTLNSVRLMNFLTHTHPTWESVKAYDSGIYKITKKLKWK